MLADSDLTEIAKVAGPGHLLAIAGRARVSAAVADVLLERRNPAAIHKLIGNLGATLSDVAFVKLVNDAKRDKTLATLIETRPDLPEELKPFLCLLK